MDKAIKWEALPKEARQFTSFLRLIIDETIESWHTDFTATYIRCIGKKCHGIIETTFDFNQDEINWRCTNCEKGGVITHIFGEAPLE